MGRGTNARYPDYQTSREVFYNANATFKHADWIVKKLSDYLYLFVPMSKEKARKEKEERKLQEKERKAQEWFELMKKGPSVSQPVESSVGQ